MGISLETHTHPMQYPYPSTCGFFHQKESKNSQIDPEMSKIWMAISMNFTKLAVTHSILVQKLCSWARFERQKCEYRYN